MWCAADGKPGDAAPADGQPHDPAAHVQPRGHAPAHHQQPPDARAHGGELATIVCEIMALACSNFSGAGEKSLGINIDVDKNKEGFLQMLELPLFR